MNLEQKSADRLGPLSMEQMTNAQRVVAQAIIDGPRKAVYGPFVPLLRSPELMQHAQRMGEYLRFRSAIGTRLSELAILVTARQWNQKVEWAIHAPIAAKCGIDRAIIDAIAQRSSQDKAIAELLPLVEDRTKQCQPHQEQTHCQRQPAQPASILAKQTKSRAAVGNVGEVKHPWQQSPGFFDVKVLYYPIFGQPVQNQTDKGSEPKEDIL